mgnify:CR=1 FL=1
MKPFQNVLKMFRVWWDAILQTIFEILSKYKVSIYMYVKQYNQMQPKTTGIDHLMQMSL